VAEWRFLYVSARLKWLRDGTGDRLDEYAAEPVITGDVNN
jgi:hypothetical protein